MQVEQVVLYFSRHRLVVPRLPRPVRRRVVKTQEEGCVAGVLLTCHAFHVVDGTPGEQVSEIAIFMLGVFAEPQVMAAVGRAMREVVDTARHRPEELLVSRAERSERRRVAEVPLADERGAVAAGAQQRRQRGM